MTLRLVLVGDWEKLPCPCSLSPCNCAKCREKPRELAQIVNKQKHANVIVLLSPSLKPSDEWVKELSSMRKQCALLGITDGEGLSPWNDLCDSLIKVDQLAAAPVILSTLEQLTVARRELYEKSAQLTQQIRLIDQVSMAIISADLDGVIKAWNHRSQVIFGLSPQEAIGQPINVVFQDVEGREFSMHKILEPLLIRNRHQFETDVRLRDGTVIPVHFSLSLEKNSQGDIIGLICCCRDISLRRRVEGERRDAFQRLTFFLESMPLGFVEWGTDFTIRAWNKSAEEIFGYGQREALGQPYSMLIKEGMGEDNRAMFKAMREKHCGFRSRNENITRDGAVIICDWTHTALLDENGKVVGYASIVDDITERILIEEELKQSREAAHAANRSKDEFLAVMSHEVRTPMNSIIGFADLLMESLKEKEEAELVNIIKANAFNLLELISNVLNYSRLEAGEVTLKEQETDLSALCHEIHEVMQAEAQEKGLSFDIAIDDRVPRQIIADYAELRQVLLNLTANALKFTEKGGVIISINAKPQADGNTWSWELIFSIKDTGIGINEADRDKLFQSFTQLDSSSTRRFGGTGLGLAICRRIVELWDGRIWAESNRGQGSTFYFTLPTFSGSGGRASGNGQVYEEIEDHQFSAIYPMKILLLTPSGPTSDIIKHIMSTLGYDIIVQYDALEAISHLQDMAYDVILIDDDLKEFTPTEIVELIQQGQAGETNRSANLLLLNERGPHNKESGAPFDSGVVEVTKPIIARNLRVALRKIAIERDAAKA